MVIGIITVLLKCTGDVQKYQHINHFTKFYIKKKNQQTTNKMTLFA